MPRNKAWLRKLFAWAQENGAMEAEWLDKVKDTPEYLDPVVILFDDVAERVERRVWKAVRAKAPRLWIASARRGLELADEDTFVVLDDAADMGRALCDPRNTTADTPIQDYYDDQCDVIVLQYSRYQPRGESSRRLEQIQRSKWTRVREHAIEEENRLGRWGCGSNNADSFDPTEVSVVDEEQQDEEWEQAVLSDETVEYAEEYYQRYC